MISLSTFKKIIEYLEFQGVISIKIAPSYDKDEEVKILAEAKDFYMITLYSEDSDKESYIERRTTEKL